MGFPGVDYATVKAPASLVGPCSGSAGRRIGLGTVPRDLRVWRESRAGPFADDTPFVSRAPLSVPQV
jgi:hypothetical protein